MVSHKFKCIFIHIPKTAGTSIESLLKDDLISGTTHELLNYHSRFNYFNDYYKFTFVRNTYERVYSVYSYYSSGGNKQHPKTIKQWIGHIYKKLTVKDYYTDVEVSKMMPNNFKEFCIKYLKEKKPFYRKNALISQYKYILHNDKIGVDFIGFFENLENDFNKVKCHLNISKKLPHLRASKVKKHYSSYYDPISIKIVSDYYYDEIKYFNFSFNNQ